MEPNKLQGEEGTRQPETVMEWVREVTIVCKNHLDIGFTESASKVVHDQVNWMIPTALRQAERLRDEGLGFCWTVGSWLIWEALERKRGRDLQDLEAGLVAGSVAWHGLPFTTHSELMDEELFEAALGLSRELDGRFGKHTMAAKMTDVPGHTRGIIPLLARAGMEWLHVGVNHMSSMPAVPPHFRWRDPDGGGEVMVTYCRGYASDLILEGHSHALLFRMVGDNMEVPSPADVREWFAHARGQFPQATVRAGRLDDFARSLRALGPTFPVLEREIGDTWIHGVGTDPWKVAAFRELLRRRRAWLRERRILPASRPLMCFSNCLSLVAEHTWGASIGPHLHDTTHYDNEDFQRVRHRGQFRVCEATWQEQRDYLEDALDCLQGTPLAADAAGALAAVRPKAPDLGLWEPCPEACSKRAASGCAFDGRTGAVTSWDNPRGRLQAGMGLACLRYQTFSSEDLAAYRLAYCGEAADPAAVDFGKPGLRPDQSASAWWMPEVAGTWSREGGMRRLTRLRFPESCHRSYGAPGEVWLETAVAADGARLEWTLSWFGKTATRLPEAFWLSFHPQVANPEDWRLVKMGRLIDPREVVSRGGRSLHACEAVVLRGGLMPLRFESLDAPLVSLGQPSLGRFDDEQPDPGAGIHVNLFNNLWGTNFPAWNGDDLQFRFLLSLVP